MAVGYEPRGIKPEDKITLLSRFFSAFGHRHSSFKSRCLAGGMFLSNLLNELFNALLKETGYLSEITIRPFNFQSPLAETPRSGY
jgi:hypothetical protein